MTGPEVMDVARDAIVTLVLVSAPLMLVVHPSIPATSVKELIALPFSS